ncbi:TIR domain-containing protein [Fulvimarina manganoxydans]|uniref:TIR domain-containing protein n=1 Tax=Fulvimarina manganoxydans TaxID=937218 RepID=A0A1W2A9G6_9HYPH|nr:toll/interleukin-1 receptor domain-containing protein [Fulvimarina manganoxydans]SMC57389.1 TIR domain-containing protein [Fulvimarina manganoxydans]
MFARRLPDQQRGFRRKSPGFHSTRADATEGVNRKDWDGDAVKIFLGYASERLEAAREIYEFLTQWGDEVWFDKEALIGGTDWDAERAEAQRSADLVVHLCSTEILQRSGVVIREIKQSLKLVEDQPFGHLFMVSIRLEPIRLPPELVRFQYIDHFADDWRERLERVIEKRRSQIAPDRDVRLPRAEPPRALPQQASTIVSQEEGPVSGSQKIQFEDVTKTYECRGEYLRYDGEGPYWTWVNAAIAAHALEDFFSTRYDFRTLEIDDFPEDERTSEWSVGTEEFFRDGDRLSLRFYNYIGYARAAHPNHYITTLNFFGEDIGTMDIQRLLGHSVTEARKVLGYCEKVIAAGFQEGTLKDRDFFDGYKEDDEDVWRLLAHFNFDRRGVTFNFSPYDVLPFVYGSHEAFVSWGVLRELVSGHDDRVVGLLAGN